MAEPKAEAAIQFIGDLINKDKVMPDFTEAGQMGGTGFAISANSKIKEADWDFMQYLCGPEGQIVFTSDASAAVPTMTGNPKVVAAFKAPYAEVFLSETRNGDVLPQFPKYVSILNNYIQPPLDKVLDRRSHRRRRPRRHHGPGERRTGGKVGSPGGRGADFGRCPTSLSVRARGAPHPASAALGRPLPGGARHPLTPRFEKGGARPGSSSPLWGEVGPVGPGEGRLSEDEQDQIFYRDAARIFGREKQVSGPPASTTTTVSFPRQRESTFPPARE
jgi:hypothetical protein